jgi:hypothetical protein
MMTMSGSKYCKQCRANLNYERSVMEAEARRAKFELNKAKQALRPLFRSSHRPKIRTERLDPVNNSQQGAVVRLSSNSSNPKPLLSGARSPTSSLVTLKRTRDQAFPNLEANEDAVELDVDSRFIRGMPKLQTQKTLLATVPKSANAIVNGLDDNLPHLITTTSDLRKNFEIGHSSHPSHFDEQLKGVWNIDDQLDPRKRMSSPIAATFPSFTFEARNRANANNYDESILDSYLYNGRKPSFGPGDIAGKLSQFRDDEHSRIVQNSIQDKEWYGRKQAEIKARGGRKGQWGRVISKEIFEERLAKGWDKHQNKPVSEEEKKNGDALLEFFGLPIKMHPVLYDGKLAMADSSLYADGRKPSRAEMALGVNVWVIQDE